MTKYTFNQKRLESAMIEKRERENISIQAASDQTGIARNTFFSIEAGRTPNIEDYAALCSWLGVSPNFFFNAKKPTNGKKK
jgi:transcriptional regulator with XRE-family HTH domain